jgi:hypothetical protein
MLAAPSRRLYEHVELAPARPRVAGPAGSPAIDATRVPVRTEQTFGPREAAAPAAPGRLDAAGLVAPARAGELAGPDGPAAEAAAGGGETVAGPELLLHAASPAAASATALMVRAARPRAASGACESRLLDNTVRSPMSGLSEGKDGSRFPYY